MFKFITTKIKWCIKHDNKSRQIANNGYEFASKTLTLNYVKSAFEKILWTVSPLPPKPRSPEGTPPDWKQPLTPEGYPPLTPEGSPPEGSPPEEIHKKKSSSSLIDMPENAKKCPKGYLSHTVNGKKMCKRKTQKKKSS